MPAPRPPEALQIRLFGGLQVHRDGQVQPLPQSRKTRALLAQLILKGTPQRREVLCDLLWEAPDDPRASLRWSLSKLRPVVNEPGIDRLAADRERAGFQRQGAWVDALDLEETCAAGVERLGTEALLEVERACAP
jgi:DNA-binding SARP family transcriptional activator